MSAVQWLFTDIDGLCNWAGVMEAVILAGVLLIAYQMQLTEKYEEIVRCNHGMWSVSRRFSMSMLMLAMCLCALYGYLRDWQPWWPYVFVIAALDFNIFSRIMIMRQDIADFRYRDDRIGSLSGNGG